MVERVAQGEVLATDRRDKVVVRRLPVLRDTCPASLAFEDAWVLGGADLSDDLGALSNTVPAPPLDDIDLNG